jgi:pyruvate ferredoxin oxidoreductase alpha subunit
MVRKYLSGCQAAALGAQISGVDVVAAYPITPQTAIVESLAESIANGKLVTEMVHVEGEHSAMSVCVGASAVGARTFTATCGQGLAYMQEPVFWAAGLRLPIVMAVTNRSLLGPNTIFCDHQDSLSQRDSGWIQLYVETCQEVLDSIILAYMVAEDPDVLLPVMVCLDGFFLSHCYEPVDVPQLEEIKVLLAKESGRYPILDPLEPKLLNVLVPPDYYTEFEYDKHISLKEAANRLEGAFTTFANHFGRSYSNLEAYELDGAEIAIIAMGSIAGTVRAVIKDLRSAGMPIGMVKVRTFRPFLNKELRDLIRGVKAVGVLDRNISFGSSGVLYQEVLRALFQEPERPHVLDFIVGLGGRDVGMETIRRAIHKLNDVLETGSVLDDVIWNDLNLQTIHSWGLEVEGDNQPQGSN